MVLFNRSSFSEQKTYKNTLELVWQDNFFFFQKKERIFFLVESEGL